MRRRICRVMLILLVVTMLASMAAAMVFDLYGVRHQEVPAASPADGSPGAAMEPAQIVSPRDLWRCVAIGQLQFGVPDSSPVGGPPRSPERLCVPTLLEVR